MIGAIRHSLRRGSTVRTDKFVKFRRGSSWLYGRLFHWDSEKHAGEP